MPRLSKKDLTAISDARFSAIDTLPTKRDIARRYGVSLRTVDRWVSDKLIPHIRFGNRCIRFRWPAVEKAVDRLMVREVQ
jgi:excisionase family DNA binding protein